MKEVLANAVDRYRLNVIAYLKEAQKAIEDMQPDERPDSEDVLECLVDKLNESKPGQKLEFRFRDLGL